MFQKDHHDISTIPAARVKQGAARLADRPEFSVPITPVVPKPKFRNGWDSMADSAFVAELASVPTRPNADLNSAEFKNRSRETRIENFDCK